jgi:hypothetical protein
MAAETSEKRCDGRCHNADSPRCSCWCQGQYHGCGSAEAQRRLIRDLGLHEAQEVARRGGRKPLSARRRGKRDDGPLFGHQVVATTRGRRVIEFAANLMRDLGFL